MTKRDIARLANRIEKKFLIWWRDRGELRCGHTQQENIFCFTFKSSKGKEFTSLQKQEILDFINILKALFSLAITKFTDAAGKITRTFVFQPQGAQ